MFCTCAGVVVWPAVFHLARSVTGTYVASAVLVGLPGLAGAAMFVERHHE